MVRAVLKWIWRVVSGADVAMGAPELWKLLVSAVAGGATAWWSWLEGHGPVWVFIAGLAVFVLVLRGWNEISWRSDRRKNVPTAESRPAGTLGAVSRQFRDRTFRNEQVEIDGHSYIDCVFDHVTFVYRGTAGFDFRNCKAVNFAIMCPRPDLDGVLRFLHSLEVLKTEKFDIVPRDQ
jgi:hypothetical protein